MHELSIAQELKTAVEEIMRDHPEERVTEVHVCIGELQSIIPETLHTSFQAITDETALHNTRLIIHPRSIKTHCATCDCEFVIKEFSFICPHCQGTQLQVISGDELHIQSLETEPWP
jgi:hydrogenase nickel incorporation protein HypA/HybF